MSNFAQYTMPKAKAITLSNVAKKLRLSRKLLFKVMEEQGMLVCDSKSKRFTSKDYGFTTQHVMRTAIYIYENKINELFIQLKLPKTSINQKICFECREVKGVLAFKERMAVCLECKKENKSLKKFKNDKESLKNCKIRINPYFLTRGNDD